MFSVFLSFLPKRACGICVVSAALLAASGCAANGFLDLSNVPAYSPTLAMSGHYLVRGKMVDVDLKDEEQKICEVIGPAFAEEYGSKTYKCFVTSSKYYLPSGKYEGITRGLYIDLDPIVDKVVEYFELENTINLPGLTAIGADTLDTGASCGQYLMRDVLYRDIYLHVVIAPFKNKQIDPDGQRSCKK